MGEPDNAMVMVRRKVSSLAVALHGIKGHAVLLVLCGVLIAAVMPQSPALPGLWPGWLGSLLAAAALLCVSRNQPRIDDREVDLILAVTALGAGIWMLRQWPTSDNPVAVTVAWLLCLAACVLVLSGTRAVMWVWPAALPALGWLLPPPGHLVAMAVALAAWGIGVFVAVTRRGWAPHDQLARIPAARHVAVGVLLVLVAVSSRIGVMS